MTVYVLVEYPLSGIEADPIRVVTERDDAEDWVRSGTPSNPRVAWRFTLVNGIAEAPEWMQRKDIP